MAPRNEVQIISNSLIFSMAKVQEVFCLAEYIGLLFNFGKAATIVLEFAEAVDFGVLNCQYTPKVDAR